MPTIEEWTRIRRIGASQIEDAEKLRSQGEFLERVAKMYFDERQPKKESMTEGDKRGMTKRLSPPSGQPRDLFFVSEKKRAGEKWPDSYFERALLTI